MTAFVASMTSFSKLRNMVLGGGREAVHSRLHLSGCWVGSHCHHTGPHTTVEKRSTMAEYQPHHDCATRPDPASLTAVQ